VATLSLLCTEVFMVFISGKRLPEFQLISSPACDLYLLALECSLWLFYNGSNNSNVHKLFSVGSSGKDEMRQRYFDVVGKCTWENILRMHWFLGLLMSLWWQYLVNYQVLKWAVSINRFHVVLRNNSDSYLPN
jgi:hypothetical protein